MSMRTIACSSSNRNSANARAVSVLQTRGALPVRTLGRLIELDPLFIELLLHLGDRVQLLQLGLPLSFEPSRLFFERGKLLFDPLQTLSGGRILLLAQALAFDFQL